MRFAMALGAAVMAAGVSVPAGAASMILPTPAPNTIATYVFKLSGPGVSAPYSVLADVSITTHEYYYDPGNLDDVKGDTQFNKVGCEIWPYDEYCSSSFTWGKSPVSPVTTSSILLAGSNDQIYLRWRMDGGIPTNYNFDFCNESVPVFALCSIVQMPNNQQNISFVSRNGEPIYFTVNSYIQAVPEPATWAMMILGFGVVGGAMRRRQRVRVSYA